ncbi:hypothetical protein AB0B86_29730 [Micromonospora sp. NPDC049047]|uniref:hypothetical protein n=1 Tax=Micromonospora sp. NPDC049047 TaxID=3155645 RepID=UPI0033F000DB
MNELLEVLRRIPQHAEKLRSDHDDQRRRGGQATPKIGGGLDHARIAAPDVVVADAGSQRVDEQTRGDALTVGVVTQGEAHHPAHDIEDRALIFAASMVGFSTASVD